MNTPALEPFSVGMHIDLDTVVYSIFSISTSIIKQNIDFFSQFQLYLLNLFLTAVYFKDGLIVLHNPVQSVLKVLH